jgi:hypothetical protein
MHQASLTPKRRLERVVESEIVDHESKLRRDVEEAEART